MMTVSLLVALTLAGGLPAPTHTTEVKTDARQELRNLERTWGDAIVRHDARTIDRILAEDYVLTTPSGQFVTRDQELENSRSSGSAAFELKGVDQAEMQVRVYGDSAVVTSRFTIKGKAEGRDVQSPFRQTDVFVKQAGRWQCVTRQATSIIEPSGPAVERVTHREAAGEKSVRNR